MTDNMLALKPVLNGGQEKQRDIVLTTINARYIHSSFGLRYLHANLQELQTAAALEEFTLEARAEDMVEAILAYQPKIVAVSVYIWNSENSARLVRLLKAVSPQAHIVLGGPEVSHEQQQAIVDAADFVISGWGEVSFLELCRQILNGQIPEEKCIAGKQAKLADIKMPYHLYSDEDIKNRIVYVEASRGCPFKCEFCLSALDKTAWPYDIDQFLQEMETLYQRGVRHFKFVDRTFNLKVANSKKILLFFLQRMDEDLFLHFEVIPDHLPEALKELIVQFPAHSLQFEIGIQTFNEEVQARIGRKQNNEKAKNNLKWIRQNTQAHVHADLIFGLPGESMDSFAQSFDTLYKLRPHEIQLGILKRLKGSPIIRHTQEFSMVYNPNPPYAIVSNSLVTYQEVQTVARMARYWDLIANSGRFGHSVSLLFDESPFHRLAVLSEYIFTRVQQTHKISLLRLYDLVYDAAVASLAVDADRLVECLGEDFSRSGLKSYPRCLKQGLSIKRDNSSINRHRLRQSRH